MSENPINDGQTDLTEVKSAAFSSRRKRTSRNFPATTFEEAINFASEIYRFGSGQPVRRLSFFDHLKRAPDSGTSRQAITNASKYGLIKGSYASDLLELNTDARPAIDEETSPREQVRARFKLAIENIEPFKQLYNRFVNNKLPASAALIDAVKEFDVAPDAATEAIETFILNTKFVGVLTTLSGAERFISLEHLLDSVPASPIAKSENYRKNEQTITKVPSTDIITSETANFESTCFYISPIGEDESVERHHSNLFLGSIIEPAIASLGLKIVRADQVDRPGMITKQIIEYIVRSRLVIVDISFHNPNVFYELALRHMMRLPIVQIARTIDRIPFDISQMRTIKIDTTSIYSLVPKLEIYKAEIASQARRAIENPESSDTPVSVYFPNLRAILE